MKECKWRWHTNYAIGAWYVTDCGKEWWPAEDDGKLCEDIMYCPYCGSPVRPQRVDEHEAPWCPTCEDLTDMLLLSEEEGWQCQLCDGDAVPVAWTDERQAAPSNRHS